MTNREITGENTANEESGPAHGRKGTDEPWKKPGQSSQDPAQKPPPKRKPKAEDNKTQ